MSIENNYFNQFLAESSPERNILEEKLNALKESSPILDLIEQKKVDLGLKAEQKKAEFINHQIGIEVQEMAILKGLVLTLLKLLNMTL